MNKDSQIELTPSEKIYYSLKNLVKRLEDTVWGSAAFDVELSKTRVELSTLVNTEIEKDRKETHKVFRHHNLFKVNDLTKQAREKLKPKEQTALINAARKLISLPKSEKDSK